MDSARLAEIVAKVRRIEIRTSRLVTETMAGQYHSVFKGRGMNVEEVREYVPGDEVRTIDWNVTARTGRPFVKKFTEERELTILLLVDVSASERFGSGTTSKRELAAEVASTLALSAIQNHDKVGLVLFTDRVEQYIPPRKGRSHVLRVVREILFFEPAHRGTDLPRALDFANQVVHRRAIAFLLSDFLLPGGLAAGRDAFARALRLTNRRHDLIALALHDPREQDLPDVGWVVLEDAESGAQVEVDTGSAAVRRRVAEAAAAEREALTQLFRGAGVDVLDLGTATPYLPALLRFFRMRAGRRS